MIKGAELAIVTLVLLVSAVGYFSEIVSNGVNIGLSLIFMTELLILYAVLKNVKLN